VSTGTGPSRFAGYTPAPPGVHPPLDHEPYRSTEWRAPRRPPLEVPVGLTEVTGPRFGHRAPSPAEADLTRQHAGEPVGQRIVVGGRVLDGNGRPVPHTLVEIWQANASGRYRHEGDRWPGSLDPNFTGAGRVLTDENGAYRFTTVKPGAYPWRNHHNAWRPAHIHFSLLGRSFSQRLVTQMYFPDDPLLDLDPIFGSVPDPAARARLVAAYDHGSTEPEWALGFRFDVVLRGRDRTPFDDDGRD
jgi:protocatechuate 3,4-dioxygenase beta subunit